MDATVVRQCNGWQLPGGDGLKDIVSLTKVGVRTTVVVSSPTCPYSLFPRALMVAAGQGQGVTAAGRDLRHTAETEQLVRNITPSLEIGRAHV